MKIVYNKKTSKQIPTNCSKCGAALQDNIQYCPHCGNRIDKVEDEVAGFVLGIISLIAWLLPVFGFFISTIGIIISGKGVSEGKKYASYGLAMSIAGIIAAFINSIAGVIMFS